MPFVGSLFAFTPLADAPVVASKNTPAFGSFGTSHSVTMPAGISAGDLLLVMFNAQASSVISASAGWTEITSVEAPGTTIETVLYGKIAGGGDTLTVSTNLDRWTSNVAFRITGCDSLSKITTGYAELNTATLVDCPSLSVGSANYLVVGLMSWLGLQSVSAYPAELANTATTGAGADTNRTCNASGYYTDNGAATVNPSSFTMSANSSGTAWTIAIKA